MRCPVCDEEVGEKDQLSIEWHEAKQWFVLFHRKNVSRIEMGQTVAVVGTSYCGEADHLSTRVLKRSFKEMYGSKRSDSDT